MKKWILVGALVLIFTAFAVYQHVQGIKPTQTTSLVSDPTLAILPNNYLPTGTVPESSSAGSNSQAPASTVSTPAPSASSTPTAPKKSSTPTPTPTAPAAQSGAYKNGTYNGAVESYFYGNTQVAAVISGGQLSNVTLLQYPTDRNTSRQISNQAMPILTAEAIQAQSANVDIVSGATQFSQAFAQSLASALNRAK